MIPLAVDATPKEWIDWWLGASWLYLTIGYPYRKAMHMVDIANAELRYLASQLEV